jgi:deoxyribose-phosphate aldolase
VDLINKYIEQTNLKPVITDKDIYTLVDEAKEHQFLGICVPPFWVKKAKRELGSVDIKLVTVIGFPLGYNMTETKVEELTRAIGDGANELDLVMNISAFKANMPWVKIELAKCATLAHSHSVLLKVIIETAYLDEDEVVKASLLSQHAGADFVKTSTGFASSGATIDQIKLMRKVLSPEVGIKASGGIKNYEQAIAFIEAGAERIGTSSGVEIMKQSKNKLT